MENCQWVVVQKIYYSIIKLILSPPCLAGGHVPKMRLQNYAHFVVKNQATL